MNRQAIVRCPYGTLAFFPDMGYGRKIGRAGIGKATRKADNLSPPAPHFFMTGCLRQEVYGEITVQEIRSKIIDLPERPPAMLDRMLAEIYETDTRSVNQAAKRNPKRFPSDFFFQLTDEEADILRFQYGTAISNRHYNDLI